MQASTRCDDRLHGFAEVVRPNPLTAVARTDFTFAFAGILRFFLLTNHIRNPRTQYLQRLLFILVLRFAVLTSRHDTCRHMSHPNSGFRRINGLAARSA